MTLISVRNKEVILTIALALTVSSIPLENKLNSWALAIFCITAFLVTPWPDGLRKLWQNKYWLLPALFFGWLAATCFWDSSGNTGFNYIEGYAIFLVMPVVMTFMPRLSTKSIIYACFSFIVSIVIICIICLVKSYLEYRISGDSRVFFYHYLGFQMDLNAIYLSNYAIACLSWLLYYHFIYKGQKPFTFKLPVTISICCFLFGVVFLLSSKLSIALMIVMILFFSLYIGHKKNKLYLSLATLAVITTISALLASNLFFLRWRISMTEVKTYTGKIDDQNGLAARTLLWQSAIELIKERPLLGYGMKGSGDELVKKYVAKNFQLGAQEKYNTHNQYLETILRAGIIGGVLLLLLITLPFVTAIKHKNLPLLMMCLHFILVSMVEATMEVQQELVFYWFFIFLFYYHYQVTPETKKINPIVS